MASRFGNMGSQISSAINAKVPQDVAANLAAAKAAEERAAQERYLMDKARTEREAAVQAATDQAASATMATTAAASGAANAAIAAQARPANGLFGGAQQLGGDLSREVKGLGGGEAANLAAAVLGGPMAALPAAAGALGGGVQNPLAGGVPDLGGAMASIPGVGGAMASIPGVGGALNMPAAIPGLAAENFRGGGFLGQLFGGGPNDWLPKLADPANFMGRKGPPVNTAGDPPNADDPKYAYKSPLDAAGGLNPGLSQTANLANKAENAKWGENLGIREASATLAPAPTAASWGADLNVHKAGVDGYVGAPGTVTSQGISAGRLDPTKHALDPTAMGAIKDRALSQGPSPWLQMAQQKQQLEESGLRDQATADSMGATATARSGLAMRGGLSGGAAERIAAGGARDLAGAKQGIARQGAMARLGLGLHDDETKNAMLMAIPGLDIQGKEFGAGLEKFNVGVGLDEQSRNAQNRLSADTFNVGKTLEQGMFNKGLEADMSRFNAGVVADTERANKLGQMDTQRFNIGNTMQNQQFNSGLGFDASRFNAGQAAATDLANKQGSMDTQRFNIGNDMQTDIWNKGAMNNASQFNIGNTLQAGQGENDYRLGKLKEEMGAWGAAKQADAMQNQGKK